MVDIHSHILFNVDDGSKSIEQSVNMLKEAKEAGFDTICCTPHYMEPNFLNDKSQNNIVFRNLSSENIRQDINIKLILGNEIYIRNSILELLEFEKLSQIGNSKYILIELPMRQELKYAKDIIIELLNHDIKVIIAHPERYNYVQKNIDYLKEFLDMGVVFQGNYASIIGYYGRDAQKTIKRLLKNNMIQLMATDAHRDDSIYLKMNNILNKLKKSVSEEYYEILVEKNPRNIINNNNVIFLEYENTKKFSFLK